METREEIGNVENTASSIQEKLTLDDTEGPKDLLEKLLALHCPFTWEMPNDIATVKHALDSAESKETCLISYTGAMILCYEYAKRGEFERALNALRGSNLIKGLDGLLEDEIDAEDTEIDVRRIPYYHVIYSSECFLLYKLKRYDECKETLAKVVPFENLSSEQQAKVYVLEAELIKEYGLAGQKQAIGILENSLKLYPKSISLHNELGTVLGRVRRSENRNTAPDCRELKALEDTWIKTKSNKAAVILALAYREFAKSLRWSHNKHDEENQKLMEDMYQKAADLYNLAYEEHKDHYIIATRVAEGLTRIPPPWRNLEKAWACLKRAVSVCQDDPYLNHTAGTFFSIKGDLKRAKFFLTLASDEMTKNYGACIDLLLINQKLDPQYNPVKDLETLLEHFHDESRVEDILCTLGAFVYFEMNDFEKAFAYWVQVIDKNIHSKRLKYFRCRLMKDQYNIHISRIVVSELQKKMGENKCSDEEKAVLEELLQLYPNLKESLFERRSSGGNVSSNSSKQKWWNSPSKEQPTREEEGSWRRTGPLPPVEKKDRDIGTSSSSQQRSHLNSSSESTSWRRQPYRPGDRSEDMAQAGRSSYHRPGSRFGRDEGRGGWQNTSSTSASGGSFSRHRETSTGSSETENWRKQPAGHPDDSRK